MKDGSAGWLDKMKATDVWSKEQSNIPVWTPNRNTFLTNAFQSRGEMNGRCRSRITCTTQTSNVSKSSTLQLASLRWEVTCRGVVVQERGGTPFRQIFWNQNGAPANIVGHRWNANTEAFRQITSYSLDWPSISLFCGPNCPQMRIFHGWHPRTPSAGGGDPVLHPPPAQLHTMCGGASSLLLGPRSRKPFPQIKIYHFTPAHMPHGITQCYLPPDRGDISTLTPAKLVLDLETPVWCKAELT